VRVWTRASGTAVGLGNRDAVFRRENAARGRQRVGKAVREFKRATLEPDTTEATPTSIPTPPTTEDTTSDRPRA
jgi:hypothetical protein